MEQEKKVTAGDIKTEQEFKIVRHEMFNIVKGPKGHFIAVGNKIVCSNLFKRVDEAKRYIDRKPWELLVNTACICFEIMNEDKKETSK